MKAKKTLVDETMVEALEKEIDFLEEKNGIPEFFVVPGENIISAKFEWSRVVSRRAERKCVTWQDRLKIKNSKVIINSEINTYEITDANNILILESAVEGIESTLK